MQNRKFKKLSTFIAATMLSVVTIEQQLLPALNCCLILKKE